MAQWYMIICPNCGKKLATTKEDAEQRINPNKSTTLFKYTCIKCRMPMLIKEKAMQEIDDPLIAEREPDAGPSDDDKRLERIALTTNHFRAYQYGEPYEGKPVAMSHGFDIVNADAEITLLGLDILKDLQELDTSLDAAVNYKIREKKTNEIIHKLKEGIKL